MPRLAAWIGLLVGLATALPALGQQKIVRYGAFEDVPVTELPLSLAIPGWDAPGFTRAARQRGTVEGEDEPSVTRYEGAFSHDGYFGAVLFVDTTRPVTWRAPTPQAVVRDFDFFRGKATTLGATGSVTNGSMEIAYVLVRVDEREPKSCAGFSGAHERVQLRGFLCAAGTSPLTDATPRFIKAIDHPGLLSPVPAALPALRTAAARPPGAPTTPRGSGGQATPLSNAQLVAYLETATALVVALQPRRSAVGSGFFVSPDRLLTNRHVVDGATKVLVTSRTLGKPSEARIVAKTDRGAIGGADYALLEVPGISHAPLAFTTEIAKLEEVIAAGYPGVTIGNDADFRAFAQGKSGAAPDLVITRGEVNALQVNRAQVPTVAHTALISEGNSGGPLVDRCGRVVGINSYIAQKTTVTGFAIASRDLIEFLSRNGVPIAVKNTVCGATDTVQH
jgi:S1-C subfamily serine protease